MGATQIEVYAKCFPKSMKKWKEEHSVKGIAHLINRWVPKRHILQSEINETVYGDELWVNYADPE